MANENRLPEKVVSAFAMGTFMASLYYKIGRASCRERV